MLPPLLALGFLFHLGLGMLIGWQPTPAALTLSQRLASTLEPLLEPVPADRKILFVDVPVSGLYFLRLVSDRTGRDLSSLAVISARLRPTSHLPRISSPGPGRLLVEATGAPYFDTPAERIFSFFPEGLVQVGRTFRLDGHAVRIAAVVSPAPEPGRGHRFFAGEPGITALEVRLDEGSPPPLVIGFQDEVPVVLSDAPGFPSRGGRDRSSVCIPPSRGGSSSRAGRPLEPPRQRRAPPSMGPL